MTTMTLKQKEAFDLVKPFFKEISIEIKNKRVIFQIKDREKYEETTIDVYVYDSGKSVIYSFGDATHSYLSPEYHNMFNFYYDFLSYMKLIRGMGEERHFKY